METVDIYALLDELQEEIDLAKNCLFSKNKSVEPEVLTEIINDIRAALDDTLEYSRKVEAEKDRILTEAHAEVTDIRLGLWLGLCHVYGLATSLDGETGQ